MKLFRRPRDFVLVIVLVVVSVILLMSNLRAKKSLNLVERSVVSILVPFQDVVDWSVLQVTTTWDDYVALLDTRQENKRLLMALDMLEFEKHALEEKLKSYDRLEKLLTFPDLVKVPFEVARVIGRDTANRMKVVTLNKGSLHGIEIDMPVVTHRGLVGRVMKVTYVACKVLLVTDVRSAIDAIAQDSRDGLIVAGANAPLLEIKYLDVNADVKDGAGIISSGLGGVFPKGLFIGYLKNIVKKEGDLFLNAKLSLAVDVNRLEEVLILKGSLPDLHEEGDEPLDKEENTE